MSYDLFWNLKVISQNLWPKFVFILIPGLYCSAIVQATDCHVSVSFSDSPSWNFATPDIFQEAGLPLWLRPYEVLVTSSYTALIETIPDTVTCYIDASSYFILRNHLLCLIRSVVHRPQFIQLRVDILMSQVCVISSMQSIKRTLQVLSLLRYFGTLPVIFWNRIWLRTCKLPLLLLIYNVISRFL